MSLSLVDISSYTIGWAKLQQQTSFGHFPFSSTCWWWLRLTCWWLRLAPHLCAEPLVSTTSDDTFLRVPRPPVSSGTTEWASPPSTRHPGGPVKTWWNTSRAPRGYQVGIGCTILEGTGWTWTEQAVESHHRSRWSDYVTKTPVLALLCQIMVRLWSDYVRIIMATQLLSHIDRCWPCRPMASTFVASVFCCHFYCGGPAAAFKVLWCPVRESRCCPAQSRNGSWTSKGFLRKSILYVNCWCAHTSWFENQEL